MPGAQDEEILRCAVEQDRWLVTYDRDYGELVYARGVPAPPAIVLLRQEPYSPARPAELLSALLAEPEIAEGHLVVLSEGPIRRRRLRHSSTATVSPTRRRPGFSVTRFMPNITPNSSLSRYVARVASGSGPVTSPVV